jgi:prepilin-type N-terminal cleavage/methylation domain-containing protein
MRARERGLTLLELVLVVAILAVLATATVAVVDQTDNQARFDATKTRAQAIHDALVGPGGMLNGSPVVSGFVADMGRLPATLAELTSQSVPNVFGLAPYANFTTLTRQDGTALQGGAVPYFASFGAGWRGPYLPLDQDANAAYGASFRDGWGNANSASLPASSPDATDFGWLLAPPGNTSSALLAPFTPDAFVLPANNTYTLKSYGSDNLDDSTYAAGTAPTWDAADQATVLGPDDYLVRVSNWTITLYLAGAPTSPNVSLRLYYPATPIPTATAPSVATALTYVQTASTPVAPVGQPTVFTGGFSYPVATGFPANPPSGDVRVPAGLRTLALFYADGNPDDPAFSTTLQANGLHWIAQVPVVLSARTAPPQGPLYVTVGAGP